MPGEHEQKMTTIWWPHGRIVSGCQVASKCMGFVLQPHTKSVEGLRAFYQSAILVVSTVDRHRDLEDPDLTVLAAWPAKDVPNTDGENYRRIYPPTPLRELYVNLLFVKRVELRHGLRIDIGAVCDAGVQPG